MVMCVCITTLCMCLCVRDCMCVLCLCACVYHTCPDAVHAMFMFSCCTIVMLTHSRYKALLLGEFSVKKKKKKQWRYILGIGVWNEGQPMGGWVWLEYNWYRNVSGDGTAGGMV